MVEVCGGRTAQGEGRRYKLLDCPADEMNEAFGKNVGNLQPIAIIVNEQQTAARHI